MLQHEKNGEVANYIMKLIKKLFSLRWKSFPDDWGDLPVWYRGVPAVQDEQTSISRSLT